MGLLVLPHTMFSIKFGFLTRTDGALDSVGEPWVASLPSVPLGHPESIVLVGLRVSSPDDLGEELVEGAKSVWGVMGHSSTLFLELGRWVPVTNILLGLSSVYSAEGQLNCLVFGCTPVKG
jgi:hypothetical protein